MQVCPDPSIPEPGAGIYISGTGVAEWKTMASKTYVSGWSGGIKTGYASILKSWLGSIYGVFEGDGSFWTGTYMGKLE